MKPTTCSALPKSYGSATLDSETTEIRIHLTTSPQEDILKYPSAVIPANARRAELAGEGVWALVGADDRILQYGIAKGTRPGVFYLARGATTIVRE